MMADVPGERRRYARIKVSLPGFVSVRRATRAEPIEVMDLSEGGSFVRGDPDDMAEGTEVHLTTEHGSSTGRVVRTDSDRPGFGVEFTRPDDHLRAYVRRLLAKRGAMRGRPSDDDPDDSED